jgi:hypothetical protein
MRAKAVIPSRSRISLPGPLWKFEFRFVPTGRRGITARGLGQGPRVLPPARLPWGRRGAACPLQLSAVGAMPVV